MSDKKKSFMHRLGCIKTKTNHTRAEEEKSETFWDRKT